MGHDLAVMSLCNHTIVSKGTFSFWMGFLSGGNVVRPDHFGDYRKPGVVYDKHLFQDPLKNPQSRLMYGAP